MPTTFARLQRRVKTAAAPPRIMSAGTRIG